MTPRDGGRFESREEARRALPRYKVGPIGLRIRRVDLDKEATSAMPRRQIPTPVVVQPPVLRKRTA